jgi:hypothetical protein
MFDSSQEVCFFSLLTIVFTTLGLRVTFKCILWNVLQQSIISTNNKNLPYSATSQALGWRRNPRIKGRGCDNVLPGQGFSTPQGEVTNEYRAMEECGLSGKIEQTRRKTYSSVTSSTTHLTCHLYWARGLAVSIQGLTTWAIVRPLEM